jgi:galactose mutarotase-like enzyme
MVSLTRDCCLQEIIDAQGLRTLVLENGILRVVVVADKGSDIVEFRHKPTGTDFLLHLPGGPRGSQAGAGGLGDQAFLDTYSGGWNEILPNGGLPSTYKGVNFGQHGEVSVMPWRYAVIENSPDRVTIKLWVRPHRTPFLLEKTLTLNIGSPVLAIDEQLTNEAGEEMHCMWGQHIAFGNPFLLEGAKIFIPAQKIIVHESMENYEPRRFSPSETFAWPYANSPTGSLDDASVIPAFGAAQAQEMAYLAELQDGWYAIVNQTHNVGFGLRFDHELFQYIWYWQQLGNVAKGYPWWGRLHTTALEPWTSYPLHGLAEAVENGTALALQPGEKINTSIKAVAFDGFTSVESISPDGEILGKRQR